MGPAGRGRRGRDVVRGRRGVPRRALSLRRDRGRRGEPAQREPPLGRAVGDASGRAGGRPGGRAAREMTMTPLEMEFFKMSGAGNDFILFDNRAGGLKGDRFGDLVRRICTRALSVGADGGIPLEPAAPPPRGDRESTSLKSSPRPLSYALFFL